MATTRKTFNLRRARLDAEITQVTLAQNVGVGEATIQRYETNGLPNKLTELGFRKYFEEIANK